MPGRKCSRRLPRIRRASDPEACILRPRAGRQDADGTTSAPRGPCGRRGAQQARPARRRPGRGAPRRHTPREACRHGLPPADEGPTRHRDDGDTDARGRLGDADDDLPRRDCQSNVPSPGDDEVGGGHEVDEPDRVEHGLDPRHPAGPEQVQGVAETAGGAGSGLALGLEEGAREQVPGGRAHAGHDAREVTQRVLQPLRVLLRGPLLGGEDGAGALEPQQGRVDVARDDEVDAPEPVAGGVEAVLAGLRSGDDQVAALRAAAISRHCYSDRRYSQPAGLSKLRWMVRGTVGWFLFPVVIAIAVLIAFIVFGRDLGLIAWPFSAIAVIFGLFAWWLYEVDGSERSLLRGMMASVFIAITVYAVTFPLLPSMFPSAMIAEEINATDCKQPHVVSTFAYQEPSLVFLLGTETRITDGAGAADFLRSGSCHFALIDPRSERSFVQRAESVGLRYSLIQRMEGYNISIGKPVSLTVFRSQASP